MSRAHLVLVGLLLVGFSAGLGFVVRDEVPALDTRLNGYAPLHTRPLTVAAEWISFVLSPGLATIALLGLGVRAWLAKDPLVFRIAVLLGLCWVTVLFRHAYRRVRPIDFPKWSYPSGHVTAVTALAFTSVVACAWLAHRWLRAVVVLAVTAVVLTAASRVVLRMHWFTDTAGAVTGVVGVGLLAGLALGLVKPGVISDRDRT